MGDLSKQKVLVTGGSRGIGAAISQLIASRGATVALNYRSNAEAAESVAKGFDNVHLVPFDVSSRDACKEGVTKAAELMGGMTAVVNNAGVAINGLLMRVKEPDFRKTIDVNVSGGYWICQAASRHLLKAKSDGRVIFLSSVVGEMGNAGQTAYCTSKAAVIGLTKSMARELAPRGVCVNAIAPGFIETDMTQSEMTEEARATVAAQIPLGRIGSAREVAGIVAFLLSDEASYITGQVIRVNGGLLM